ncbi:NUDIX domain-containing protein [Patescibacteria group bacterium]|nr:NUDIX domain-containing protein [Patescibacteria group bacterium]MBU0963605.1 NUDIX domain-containing protein [Patescibacteria group bacterium]
MSVKSEKYFKYCPRCADKLVLRKKGHTAGRLICKKCEFVFYQNSSPTVSAIIISSDGKVLLVKRGINPKKGYWDTPGGFLEEGEDPVVGIKREIKEELGVNVRVVRLLGIYMDLYNHQYMIRTLNIAYQARIISGKIKPMSDVSSTRWFLPSKIPWPRLAFKWIKPALKDWLNYNY